MTAMAMLALTALVSAVLGAALAWLLLRGGKIILFRRLALQRRTLVELAQMALAGDNMELSSRVAFQRGAKAIGADAIVWLVCEENRCRILSSAGHGFRSGELWPGLAPIPQSIQNLGLYEIQVRDADAASRDFYEKRGFAYCLGAHALIGNEDGCLLVLFRRKPSLSAFDRDFVRAMAGTLSYALQRNYYEEQLSLAKQRQAAALESLEAGVWAVDLERRTAEYDAVYAEHLGLPGAAQDVPLEKFWQVHPDDAPQVHLAFSNFISGAARRYVSEHRNRLLDGSYEWFHAAGQIVERDREGKARRVIGSQVNIDSRKRVEEMLHTVNYTLETLLRISPIAIVALKQDVTPVLWNPAADRVLGMRPRGESIKSLLEWIRSSPPLDGQERELRAEDGSIRHLRIWSNLGHGTQLIMALDVTADVTAAAERRKLESLLVNRQKLEAIGSLASGVAHEINNPLTSVVNFGQLILDRLPAADPLRRFADGIVKEGLRISVIVRDLLSFSRPDEDQEERFEVRPMLEAVLGFVAQSLRKARCSVRLNVPPGVFARGRLRQLQQVILNLVNNAAYSLTAKYPRYDEHKVIEVSCEPLTDAEGSWLRISVKDFGSGIPADVLPRIFDPFFTTKPRDVGTGLGLSISYDIVRKHGGRIAAESDGSSYSVFTVDLPNGE